MVIKTAKGVRWQARFFNYKGDGLESGYGSTEAEAIGNLILMYPSRVDVILQRVQAQQENPCVGVGEAIEEANEGRKRHPFRTIRRGTCSNCHKEGPMYQNPGDEKWYCEYGCRPPHRHVCPAEVRSDCDGTCQ